jgi:hypothetical protein
MIITHPLKVLKAKYSVFKDTTAFEKMQECCRLYLFQKTSEYKSVNLNIFKKTIRFDVTNLF